MANRPQSERDLPAFVSAFNDRHGTARYRFRRTGSASYYFRGAIGTDEFAEEYQRCLLNSEHPKGPPTQIEILRKLMAAVRHRHGRNVSSFVYAVGDPTGPIKIGLAADPVLRLCDLQIGNPRKLEVVGLRSGDRVSERSLHSRLSHARMSGEWFEREAVLRIMKWRGIWLTPDSVYLSNPDESNANAG